MTYSWEADLRPAVYKLMQIAEVTKAPIDIGDVPAAHQQDNSQGQNTTNQHTKHVSTAWRRDSTPEPVKC